MQARANLLLFYKLQMPFLQVTKNLFTSYKESFYKLQMTYLFIFYNLKDNFLQVKITLLQVKIILLQVKFNILQVASDPFTIYHQSERLGCVRLD